ncbi:asparagine synthase (glutamine-hydrolyzing) [Campylobacter curvus]|uniref:asparagine synthase (glutamine-hydrolyzing) n=1 Tax=Campylobacter curvus TaxID=200 RepID=UPI0014706A91|nr:asparagine synthase (glutamine-hydrolyzing) [Campylobacter curvus]
MCGIVGFLSKSNQERILKNMLKIQSYRGPDDSGIFIDEASGVHLGHNRLSILDLSTNAHQPFVSDCGEYVIVFNGEIYNFKTIRKELEKLGYRFLSSSDTEAILYAYKHWGAACVHKFIGMFAFAILDKANNELVLFRDRAGVKPLYYYLDNQNFIFSSEIKSFHKHPNFKKEQNLDALAYFFRYGYILAPYTIFKNCFKLPAGYYLKYDLKSLTFEIKQYWDVSKFYQDSKFDKTEEKILSEFEILLEDAASLRMVSDVPVGVFLSGGYDSTLIAALLCKTQNIDTFTIGFDDANFNEANHAKMIAKYLKTNHQEYYMNQNDMTRLIDKLPFFYDEPFGDSSALATMVLSKFAKQSVSVALSADGGDELFCGYSKYFFLNKFNNIFQSDLKKKILRTGINLASVNLIDFINANFPRKLRQTNLKDKFNKLKRAVNADTPSDMFISASSYTDKNDINKILKTHNDQKYYDSWQNSLNLDFLDYMMMMDYKNFMCDDVLTKVDRATMSVGLEGREPLIDHRLIEYLARVPAKIKYKNNQGKYLLRQILYKYIPQNIVDKPKSGFQIPLAKWLRGKLRELVRMYLNDEKIDETIFDKKEIKAVMKRFFDGEELQTLIWFLLVYQMWKEKWLE